MYSYQDHTDMDLVHLLMMGDTKAFETIYRRYVARLYNYARKSIARKEDCEEVIQDVFESIWQRREHLGNIQVLEAYLFRMVRYKVIRYFQRSTLKRKYEEHFKLFETLYSNIEDFERAPASIQSLIETGLRSLPERCQFAVRLRLFENLSNDEIATRMKIKKSTVERYMVKALSHMKTTFENT